MPRIIKNLPNFKLPKLKLKDIGDIDELRSDYAQKNYESYKNIIEGKKAEHALYPGTHYNTVKEIFLKSTETYGNRPFIIETFNKKAGFEEITYSKFRRDVLNFGTGLIRALRLEDEKVMIIGETTYDWYVSYMALLCGAGIAVPTDKELPENELENVINRSKAAAIICSPKKKDIVKKVSARCPSVKYIIEMKSDEPVDGKTVGFNYVMSEGEVFTELGHSKLLDKEVNPNGFAVLIFTSGTTSAAKGVMISNKNLAANVNGITPYVNLSEEDRLFSVLPLHHTYESTIGFIYPMACGASIVVCQGLKHIASNMQDTHPTSIIAVPLLIEALYNKINKGIEKSGKGSTVRSLIKLSNGLKNVGIDIKRKVFNDIYQGFGGNLKRVVSAAAPIDVRIGKWFEDIGITFLQGYGLTETAPIAALTPDFNTRVGSAGKAVVCDEIKIQNPNSKGEGEVLIKGDTVMLGYYQDEEATADAVTDGWFNSGDIGYLDEEGFLYITGRSKNVIVTQNGKNIYPEEIEGILSNIPEIAECMVYGKEVPGEKELIITARIIPDYEKIRELHGQDKEEAQEFTDEEIQKILWDQMKLANRKISNYKCIRKVEIKKDQFEKTTTMKIKRFAELRKIKEEESSSDINNRGDKNQASNVLSKKEAKKIAKKDRKKEKKEKKEQKKKAKEE